MLLGYSVRDKIEGIFENHQVEVFDVYNRHSEGTDWYATCFLLKHNRELPDLSISQRKSVKDYLNTILGAKAVEREWETIEEMFSKAFRIDTKDEQLAQSICHRGLMEYLLEHRDDFSEIRIQENTIELITAVQDNRI